MKSRTLRLSILLALSAPGLVGAADLGARGGALSESKPIFDARLRYEDVDQTPMAEDAVLSASAPAKSPRARRAPARSE